MPKRIPISTGIVILFLSRQHREFTSSFAANFAKLVITEEKEA
jgi:hypothetical protein